MTNFRQSFPGKKESDRVLIFAKKHWIRYVVVGIVSFLLLTIPASLIIYFLLGSREIDLAWAETLTVGIGIYLLLLTGVVFRAFVDFYLDTLVVTEEKLVYVRQNGYFFQQIDEIYLNDIQEVAVDIHGFLKSFLDYGDLIIHSGSDIAVLTIDNMPHPHKIARQIMDMHKEHTPASSSKEGDNKSEVIVNRPTLGDLADEIKETIEKI